jgi:uncharacterized protein DUF11
VRLRPSAGRAARLAAVLAGSLALGLVATTGPALAAPATQVVSDAQLPVGPPPHPVSGMYKELRDTGTAAVVDRGAASYLRLATPAGNDKATVWTTAFNGRPLADITNLEYSTLVETVGTNNDQQAPAINISINPNKGDQTFTNLVFEPIYTGTPVKVGEWQTWRPSTTSSPKGGWWASGKFAGDGAPNGFGFNSFQASLAEVKAALPNAVVSTIGVNQGGGNPGLTADVDKLTINDLTIDFDNPVVPTAIAQVSGNGQSAAALTPFAQPLAVKLTGRDGTVPAAGATVTYTVTPNGNTTYPAATFPGGATTATAVTGPDGVATSPTLTAGLIPGPVTVTATSGTQSTTFTLTVTPPAGPARADLSLAVTGVPATVAHGNSFTATVTVRNNSSFPTTQVRTAVTAPSGLRITAAPGGMATGSAAAFVAPTLAPGASLTYTVTFAADAGARGAKTITAVVNSAVTDPNLLNNTDRPVVTIT